MVDIGAHAVDNDVIGPDTLIVLLVDIILEQRVKQIEADI